MVYTVQQVRDNIRNADGKLVFYLGSHDRLTDEAKDYLARRGIPILPGAQAKPEKYRLENGAYFLEKPEWMTHLHGDVLVPKTHPRIRFRGTMDTLESELLLCQKNCGRYRQEMGEILALARQIVRCEVMDEPLKTLSLCGLNEEQLRRQSHFPQQYFGIAHFMPEWDDKEPILALNRVRCAARQAELAGAAAFCPEGKEPERTDILQALNRMSSMLYLLMLRTKAG